MHLDQPGDHLALAFAHGWHIDLPVILANSEFLASPEVRGDFGAMDHILARKAGDVGARTSDIFSLNDGSLHPLPGQRPGDVFPGFAAAQHEEIVFFQLRGWCLHECNCWWIGSSIEERVMTTRAPSAARALAMAKPMPAVEPVTRASVFSSCRFMLLSFWNLTLARERCRVFAFLK